MYSPASGSVFFLLPELLNIQTHQHRKIPFHQVHTALNVAHHCDSVREIVNADFDVRVLAGGRNCGGLLLCLALDESKRPDFIHDCFSSSKRAP
jgi:hypothetical protein